MANRIYETAIKISATLSKAFGGDVRNATKALLGLSSATKGLQGAKQSAAAFARLEAAVAGSKHKLDAAAGALHALEAAEKAAGAATKESTKWRKAGERAVAAASREYDRATKAVERLTHAEEKAARAQFNAAKKRLFGESDKTPLFQKAGDQIRGIARDAIYLGTATIGAGAAVGALVLKTLKAGDEIGDTADKLGIGTTALQELRYAAKQSGDEAGYIDQALNKLAITVGKFKNTHGKGGGGGGGSIPGLEMFANLSASGGGSTFNPFEKIGLKAKELAKLKPEEQIKKIADGLLTLKTHDDQAAVAAAIFGKGAKEDLPLFLAGSKGIEEMTKAAHKYGGVLSEDAIKNADLADKAMRDAEMAFGGLTATLTADLLPVATKVFREFSKWVAENRGQIKQWAENAARWIEDKGIPAFKQIATEVGSFAKKMLTLVEGAAKLTGGFDNLAIAVAALRLAPLATTMGKIAITGLEAAGAVFKYAAAVKAAKAAEEGGEVASEAGGGIFGGIKKLLGVGGPAALAAGGQVALAGAAGLAYGALVGYGLDKASSYIEDKTGRNLNPFTNVSGNDIKAKSGEIARLKAIRDQRRRERAAAGPGAPINVNVNVGTDATKQDVTKALKKTEKDVHAAIDRREANQRRVSFGE